MHSRFLGLAVLLAACGSDSHDTIDASIDAPGAPGLAVTASPTTLAQGETVTFEVTVTNLEVVNPNTVSEPVPGEGHFHYYRDDDTNYTAGWTPTVTFRTGPLTTPGEHVFHFELATNVHEELTPPVEATATFTVTE